MFGLNLGSGNKDGRASRLLYVWDAKVLPSNLEDGFYGKVTTNYNGHKFIFSTARIEVDTMFCSKKRKNLEETKPGQDTKEYLQCGGFGTYQSDFAGEMFNLTWGAITTRGVVVGEFINETQRWIGAMEDLVYYRADYLFGITLVNPANRVFYAPNSMLPDQHYDILAPYPKKLNKFYALVFPYSASLWPFVLGSLVIMSVTFPLVSYLQRKVQNLKNVLVCEQEIGVSSWFSFSALIGENMRGESVTYHRGSIRYKKGLKSPSLLDYKGYVHYHL